MDTKDNGRSDTGMGPLEAVDIQVDSNAGLDNWLEKKLDKILIPVDDIYSSQ